MLDASAVLAVLHREPGAETVQKVLGRAAISAVNAAEVATKLVRLGESETDARADLAALRLEILPFDEELAFVAAGLEVVARGRGLSLGDRACLATAHMLGLPALTADRNWRIPDLKIKLRFIR